MTELLIIAISSALVSNVVLSQFLGICSFVGVSKSLKNSAGMGGAVIFVISIASIVANLLYTFILAPLGLDYLKTIVFILVIAALVQIVEMFMKKMMVGLYEALGVYLPLITTNCAVLGVCIANIDKGYGFGQSIANAFGAAVGFTIALVLFAGIRSTKLANEDGVPKSFRGVPLVLVSSAIMAIAFMGFSGMFS